jgi:hypothetical protein
MISKEAAWELGALAGAAALRKEAEARGLLKQATNEASMPDRSRTQHSQRNSGQVNMPMTHGSSKPEGTTTEPPGAGVEFGAMFGFGSSAGDTPTAPTDGTGSGREEPEEATHHASEDASFPAMTSEYGEHAASFSPAFKMGAKVGMRSFLDNHKAAQQRGRQLRKG